MLVQTSSPPHHCSSGSTDSLPPGVLQPEPAPAPTRGPTTNSYIAQPGTAYASAGHGHHWTPQPCLVYWIPGNYCTLRQRSVPVDNSPRRTTVVYPPTSTAPVFIYLCRRFYPYTRARHATDAATFHTCGSAPNPLSEAIFLSCCFRPTLPTPISPIGDTSGFVPQLLDPQPPPSNRTQRSFVDRQCSYQRRSEVLRQRSQDSSSATPNNSTQLSDVPHQDG